ncbi:NAD(P)-binding protein [Paraphaeosphaeria sporulosa]|uniref:NAD(P)-binding protein n=1 Tax=Paraphaeosphaeria sporulosa TaxID=1460663 RepID=A0A177CCY8_9PLEO|nr:NAD(P)-binding protein [Paraphaeosphaeria sporulosa]OAG04638.1 NAD(P)-binding protein [Paraphaeosphaeria sporulosa]
MTGPRLLNKVAIVTGSSQGIGREICNQFHEEGALLVCSDLRPLGQGEDVATHESIVKKGGKAIFVQTDVSKAEDWVALISKTVEEYGRLDILVNNAGICTEADNPQPIDEVDEDAFDTHLRVNTRGVFLGCKYAVRQFKKQKLHPSGVRGWIVNFASMVANIGMAGLSGYTASKGAVAALTKTVALDVAKQGIVANSICPGSMLDNALGGALSSARDAVLAALPRGRFGETKDHARAAVYLASDDAAWVTGINLNVDGGLTAQ